MEIQSSSPNTTSSFFDVHMNEQAKPSSSPSSRIIFKPTEVEKKDVEPMTVAKDFAIKHPLQNSWTLWFDNPGHKTNSKNWSQNLKQVFTFASVEDFWGLFNNIVPASQLPLGSNYHLFKTGIEPKWEDVANANGGKWTVQFPAKQRANLDQMWLFAILAIIGEDFMDSDKINGLVMSVRKQQDKLSLWTADSDDEGAMRRIGASFKEHLNLENIALGFQDHRESLRSNKSWGNQTKYEV
jgi:translation initiation factor 4E